MRKVVVLVFLDHRDNYMHVKVNVPDKGSFRYLIFDENTPYEEMVRILVQERLLFPLDDPRLYYHFVLQAYEVSWHMPFLPQSLSQPVTFSEGQTLASTHLTHLIINESEFRKKIIGQRINVLFCSVSIEIRDIPPPKDFLTSPTVGMIEFISSVVALAVSPIAVIPLLTAVWRGWPKKGDTNTASSQGRPSQPSEPDIVAVRLQMTDRTEATFPEWITDPARLKHYIDIFLQPSPSAKPVQVAFALKGGDTIFIDVTEGAQNNLQLNEVLSYLHIDPAQQ
jgi:hypothetical protein